ncbi:FecR family protein [Aliirhizobium smilacinae]|uniref:FecR family protein n=1 Tax=Aliirhizobium smilacinae TaxID=1395944 RepID=A0A5C4XHN4_9HYPH|nr:FecR family protein [Rhizobium smilacinae]TNM63023.1 FecR family protein [Rhizobium smilacinae]
MTDAKTSEKKLRAQAIDWMLRLQENPDDVVLTQRFQHWLGEDPNRAVVYERACRAMGDASHLLTSDLDFTRNAAHKPLLRRRNVVAGLLLVLGGSIAFALADGPMRLRADVITGTGQQQSVTLADGSIVEMNAESAIAIHLSQSQRRISLLRGEAFFQVAADPTRPFVVEAGAGTTTALGTAFDINLTQQGTKVVVTEHAVMVAPEDGDRAHRLQEGEQISYDLDGHLYTAAAADIDTATAWRQGRIIFDNSPLSSVVEQIDRYIPGRIVIAQSYLADRRISGSLDLARPDTALDAFANAIGIRITRLGPYLTILRQ